jgi:adenylylsulfate kinase-like enzyme
LGEIKDFTGIQSVYENPEQAFLEIFTDDYSIDESLEIIVEKIILLLQ